MSAIVKKIYMFRKYDNLKFEANKKMVATGQSSKKQKKKAYRDELASVKNKEVDLYQQFKEKENVEAKDLPSLFFAFLNRARLKYTIGDIFKFMFMCLCCRSIDDRRKESTFKKHFLFQKAEDKFMIELDAVRIVKTLRRFKMLA